MTKIYTLTLAPSLDSATQTPQIYPEGKLRCSAPVFEPGGGGILMQLVKNAQQQGLRCIIDSSGDALAAALDVGNIELVKPNQKELSALVQRDLSQPDDVRLAAQSLIQSGKVRRVVVSLGPQGALGVDASGSVQVVPPPMKSQSTVGAGDSMVGAMTLRLAENASLEDMVRFGVAAGSAATINQGTRLCSRANTQKIYDYLCGR